MKKRIGLDLDGVVYDFQGTYCYLLKTYRDVQFPEGLEWWSYWDAADQFTSKADRDWVWSKGIEHGLFRYGHLLKGAIDGVAALGKLGQVEVVSHRPASAVHDTLSFLAYTKLDLAGIHLLTNAEPKSQVRCDVYVDDGPHVVEELTEAGLPVVIVDAPYNRKVEGVRAYGWQDIPDRVEEML